MCLLQASQAKFTGIVFVAFVSGLHEKQLELFFSAFYFSLSVEHVSSLLFGMSWHTPGNQIKLQVNSSRTSSSLFVPFQRCAAIFRAHQKSFTNGVTSGKTFGPATQNRYIVRCVKQVSYFTQDIYAQEHVANPIFGAKNKKQNMLNTRTKKRQELLNINAFQRVFFRKDMLLLLPQP